MAKHERIVGGNEKNSGSQGERMDDSKTQRQHDAKKREALMRCGVGLILLAAIVVICVIFFYKVQNVIVIDDSRQRYTEYEIRNAAGIAGEMSMLALKPDEIAARIEEALPYLENVKVRKTFPLNVEIRVQYARPAVAYAAEDGYVLMSASGKVLETGVGETSDYVARLLGVEMTSATPGQKAGFVGADTFDVVVGVVGAFNDAGYLNVTSYDLTDRTDVTVEIDYKVDVLLGGVDRIAEKLVFGKEVLDRTLADASDTEGKYVVDMKSVDKKAFVRTHAEIDAAKEAASIRAESQTLPSETTTEAPTEGALRYGETPAETTAEAED